MAADVALTVEHSADPGKPEQRLWNAALGLFVSDALGHHRQAQPSKATSRERVTAYNDLLNCGPQTRRLAAMAGYDAVWLSEQFMQTITPNSASEISKHLQKQEQWQSRR